MAEEHFWDLSVMWNEPCWICSELGHLQSAVVLVRIWLDLHMQDEWLYNPVAPAALLCVCKTLVRWFWCTWAIHCSFHACRMIPRGSCEVILLRQKQLVLRSSLQEDRFVKLEH